VKEFKKSHPQISNTSTLLQWASIPRSTFYHRCSDRKRGRRSRESTLKNLSKVVDNREIVKQIEESMSWVFCFYVYKNACQCLKEAGFIINQKKVYRLMKEHNLLFSSKIGKVKAPRTFVRYQKIEVGTPHEIHVYGHQVYQYPWCQTKCVVAHGHRRI
jgi:hypothetical protein